MAAGPERLGLPPGSAGGAGGVPSEPPLELCGFEIHRYKLYLCLKTSIDANNQLNEQESAQLLDKFMPQNVRIITTVFYGSTKVRSIAFTGKTKLILGHVNHDKQDRKEFEIVVAHEKFRFCDLDPSGVEGIHGDRDTPYVIVRLVYLVTDEHIAHKLAQKAVPGSTAPGSVQLGYARMEMSKVKRAEDKTALWSAPLGSTKLDLCPGSFTLHNDPNAIDQKNNSLVILDSDGSYVEVDVSEPRANTPRPQTVTAAETTRSDQLFPKRTFWTQYNPRTQAILPAVRTCNRQSFDIYIDQVKHLPDNCCMCKVTGRIFQSGMNIPDLEALPILDSDARSPSFQHKTTVAALSANQNGEEVEVDPFSVLVLRVYILDRHSSELVVLGSGVLLLYEIQEGKSNKRRTVSIEGLLNHGGHQVRLFWGFPAQHRPLGVDSFCDNAPIPGTCSVLVRLLPHSEEFVSAPSYQTGYYKSDSCEPNESDVRVLSHYLRHENFPTTVRDSIKLLTDKGESSSVSDHSLIAFMREKLDRRNVAVSANQKSLPEFVTLDRCLDYDIGSGVFAKIEQAFGLDSEDMYCSCFARISAGEASMGWDESPEGFGGECKFMVNCHNYQSLQHSPKWTDAPYKMNPHFDEFTCLLIQIFALDVDYEGDPECARPGTVLPRQGRESLALEKENQMGWAAVNLFRGSQTVNSGIHYLPVLQQQPSLVFMEKALSMSVEDAMSQSVQQGEDSLHKSCPSLRVKIFDGNFVNESEAIPLQENFDLEKKVAEISGIDRADFHQRRSLTSGELYSALVLKTMKKEEKEDEVSLNSKKYKKAEHYYEMAMSDTFYNLLEDQMMEAAMGPFTNATSDEQFDPESLFYNFG